MPKLGQHTVERNQVKIEQAALRLFTRQGFHGTSVREIADEAGISLGNIYNYFPTKEALFASLAKRYEDRMEALQRRTVLPLLGSFAPRDLERLARAIRRVVYSNPDYWRLMYLDIIEFDNRHFAHIYRHLARNLERYARERRGSLRGRDGHGVNQPLAMTALYPQFFTYFLIEKLFGGKQHLGLPDDRAIAELIRIFTSGVSDGSPSNGSGRAPARASRRKS